MNKRHGKRGSSLPETVIVLIVLLTLTFGLMDFGRAIYTFAWITDIAQRARRWFDGSAVRPAPSSTIAVSTVATTTRRCSFQGTTSAS